MSLVLEALGAYWCKSQEYEAVQAVAQRVSGFKRRQQVFQGVRAPALGCDITSVKCNGRGSLWLLTYTRPNVIHWVLTGTVTFTHIRPFFFAYLETIKPHTDSYIAFASRAAALASGL